MPGRTPKFFTRAPGAEPPAYEPVDELADELGDEELAHDHVVRRFFATHEDLRPGHRRHEAHGPESRGRRRHPTDDEG